MKDNPITKCFNCKAEIEPDLPKINVLQGGKVRVWCEECVMGLRIEKEKRSVKQ